MAVLKTQQVECEMDHGEFWFAHLSTVNCSLSAELDEVLYSSEILSGYSSLRHYETIFVDLGKKSVGCDLPSLCFIVCLICCLISSCQGFYNLLDSLQYEFDFNLHQPFRTLCIWNKLFLGSYFGHLSLSGSIILLCQENLLRLFLFFCIFLVRSLEDLSGVTLPPGSYIEVKTWCVQVWPGGFHCFHKFFFREDLVSHGLFEPLNFPWNNHRLKLGFERPLV